MCDANVDIINIDSVIMYLGIICAKF